MLKQVVYCIAVCVMMTGGIIASIGLGMAYLSAGRENREP